MLQKQQFIWLIILTLVVLVILCYVFWVYEVQAPEKNNIKVEVYFGNTVNNPNSLDCSQVFLVERLVPKQDSLPTAALQALIDGPTMEELKAGFFTSLNPNIKIQTVKIQGDTIKVDFDETLAKAVGGSCRVAAIRAQITKTLLQWPNIKKVIISINGRTEDILQP